MATTLEEAQISYEELSDLEQEFDDVETEISEFPCLANFFPYAKKG